MYSYTVRLELRTSFERGCKWWWWYCPFHTSHSLGLETLDKGWLAIFGLLFHQSRALLLFPPGHSKCLWGTEKKGKMNEWVNCWSLDQQLAEGYECIFTRLCFFQTMIFLNKVYKLKALFKRANLILGQFRARFFYWHIYSTYLF